MFVKICTFDIITNMGNVCETKESNLCSTQQNSQVETGNEKGEQLSNDGITSAQKVKPELIVEVINEKGEQLSKGDGIPKPVIPVSLRNDEIINVQKVESEPIVEVINEKNERLSEGESIPKPNMPVSLPNDGITSAQKVKPQLIVEVINEKGEDISKGDSMPKPVIPVLLPNDEINVQKVESEHIVEIINEKGERLSEGESIPKPNMPVSLPNDETTSAQKVESEPGRSYAYADQGGYYGQTPYYQQQQIAGQPVYIQGSRPPDNAARMAAYRPRRDDYDYREDYFIFAESFDDVIIRNRFVQRVYTILTVQLIYTCAFIALCIFSPGMKLFILTNLALLLLASVSYFVIMCVLTCCVPARRIFPLNFILLGLFTMSLAYLMAIISATYSTFIVMSSMGITAAVCLLVSVFACQTSFDVTNWGMYLCITSIVVIIFGFIAILVAIITGSTVMFLIYAAIIALLFSVYLMYDTQMIMGGRRVELSPEEYIFGALCLYVDIMEIFWAILMICGLSRQ